MELIGIIMMIADDGQGSCKHIIYETISNIMERFIQQIKERAECFNDNFPCKSHGCDRKHICNWLRMHILYLHINRELFMDFVTEQIKLTEPNDVIFLSSLFS